MTDSDNVELKKRARRRLVGAAALALLAAIILPMVMDQEPSAPAQDIQVTIPDREADNTLSRPIASRPARESEPQLAPAPEEQPPAPASPDVPRRETAARIAPPPQRPAPSHVASDVPKAPAPASAAAEPLKPAPLPPVKNTATDSGRAQAILEGKPTAASTAAAGSAFVVQIGAFGDGGKAALIAADLKRRGFSAYTEKVGAVTRVRVGPFGGREDAERAAQRVRASGMSGSVVPK
ncbi:SPOR domain-containing protein [Aromatoleum toluclasticum]|uniref:SPOR domain-containing protein n=1 Tax=Aromatoleum toluclasticum TaxID=92003 RepID=UPI001D1870BC|nr:SPOR domain-containing protein [Aromatoleum toluclasticum]MCC4116737.1 SPOR domain-containing protein [Aromatoleum toluclasticum]